MNYASKVNSKELYLMIKYYVYEKSTSFINYLVSNNIYYNKAII